MNVTILATLAIAGTSVLGSIMAVLLLAYRVGRLTGTTEAKIAAGEDDRSKLWRVVDALGEMVHRHLEGHQ